MTELPQRLSQTGANIIAALNDKNSTPVGTALVHLVEYFGSGEI